MCEASRAQRMDEPTDEPDGRSAAIDRLADEVEGNAGLDSAKDLRSLLAAIPGLRRHVIAAAIRALTARKYYFSKSAKEMVFEPDSTTQMKAVSFLAAYADGLPLQSTVNVNVEAGAKGLSMADALENSPALRDFMREALAKSEGRKALAV